jgi:hypothetical protein
MIGVRVPNPFSVRFLRAKSNMFGAHYHPRFGGRFSQGSVQSDSIGIRRGIAISLNFGSGVS